MADYLDHLNEKYGQGGSNTTSVQNNASSQGDYLNHLKQKYGGNTPTTQFLVDAETKIPSMDNLSTNAINSSESPNSSVLSLSDADIISKYESIPNYNVLSRWVDKDKSNAYKQKQDMYGDYKAAKTREVGKLVEELGITEDDLNLSKGQVMGVSINPVGLNKYNLTDEQKRDISEYAQDYFNQKRSASVTEYADKHPVLSTGLSFVSNPVESAVDTLQTGIDYVSGNPISKKTTDVTQNIRDTVSEDMGTVGKTVYGIGTSIGDMLVAAATGQPGAIMGLEKASSTMSEATERGLTPTQIVAEGIFSGITTAITEGKVFDNFSNAMLKGLNTKAGESVAKQLVKEMAKGFFAEGGQEVAEGTLDFLVDQVVANLLSATDKSDYRTRLNEYLNSGLTEDDAKKQVAKDYVATAFTDFIAGGAAGSLFGGGAYLVGKAGNTINGTDNMSFGNLTEETPESKMQTREFEQRAEERRAAAENERLRLEEEQRINDEDMARRDSIALEEYIPGLDELLNDEIYTPGMRPFTLEEENALNRKMEFDERADGMAWDIAYASPYGVESDQYRTFQNARESFQRYLDTGLESERNKAIRNARLIQNPEARALLENYMNGLDISEPGAEIDSFTDPQQVLDFTNNKQGIDDFMGKNGDARNYTIYRELDAKLNELFTYDDADPNVNRDTLITEAQALADELVASFPKEKRAEARKRINERLAMFGATSRARQSVPTLESTNKPLTVNASVPKVDQVKRTPSTNARNVVNSNMDYDANADLKPNATNGKQEQNSYYNETVKRTEVPKEVLQELGTQYYTVASNKDTQARANSIMANNSVDDAYGIFNDLLRNRDPAAIPLGVELAKVVSPAQAVEIVEKMSTALTKSGQFSQAAAIGLLKSNPIGALNYIRNQIAKMNEEGQKIYHNKWKDFELTTSETNALRNVKPGDSQAIQKIYDQITDRIANEYPSSFWEKSVELSKLAMLLNPKTHITNTAANLVMSPVTSLSDRINAIGQNAYKLLIDSDYEVTQSLKGGSKDQKNLAGKIFDEQIKGRLEDTNKYDETNLKNVASRKKQMFKSSALGKLSKDATIKMVSTLNNISGGRLDATLSHLNESMTDSAIENLRKFDYYLLGEVEDTPFVKKRFVNRLASYMAAQNITDINNVSPEAIEVAYEEALKATFKDTNWLTKSLSSTKKNWGKLGDVLFPFTTTPANIAMRGLEYSPVGIAMAIRQETQANGVEGLNKVLANPDFARGMLGTVGIAVGYLLAKSGIIKGALPEDKDEKAFAQQQGQMAYSIKVGDKYVTFDWAQPAAIPLIIGSSIYDGIANEESDVISIARQAASSSFDAWLGLSPLQTLNDLFGGNGYGNNSTGENLITELMEYPQRFVPSILGATARATDNNYRETYDSTSVANTYKNQLMAKIPGLSDNLPTQYDTWGNERLRQGDAGSAAIAQFVSPGKVGYDASTDIDDEILSLYESTNSSRVFPNKAPYNYTDPESDKSVKLNNEQHSNLQKQMGEKSYELASSFINGKYYGEVNDDTKAEILGGLYSLAQDIAMFEQFGETMSSANEKLYSVYNEQGADGVISYLATQKAIRNATNSSSKQADIIPALGNMNLTDEERGKYLIDKSSEIPKAVQPYVEDGDYAKVYTYYKIKTGADEDGNGSITKEDLAKYLKNSELTLEERLAWYKEFYPKAESQDIPRLW